MKRETRTKLVFYLTALSAFEFSECLWATDEVFENRIKRIQASQLVLGQRLKSIGIPVNNLGQDSHSKIHPSDPNPEEESAQDHRPLLQVQTSQPNLRAPAGKLIYGQILNRLIVGTEPTPTVILLDGEQNWFSGLRALGRARPSGTEGRIAIEIDRLISNSGKIISILGLGLDPAGGFGLEAQTFNSRAVEIAGSMASSFISGLASSQQSQTTNALGFTQMEPTGRNALLQGVAQTAADQSKRLIQDATRAKPVLVLEAGAPLAIYLDREVRF